ncbi:MAG: hypothetical protein GQ582_08155 [Methyloprofundus sp.]|nr:hypothetical protein [Methyloprofundus sp.]
MPTGINNTVSTQTLEEPENTWLANLFYVDENEPFINVSGFWDIRGGVRTQSDPHEDTFSLGETRLQIALQKDVGPVSFNVVSDFLYDPIALSQHVDLKTGQGWVDLREANLAFSPLSFMDIKFGRQILTWGTGDLIFINDLFPKDWQAFFIGRDLEYLKAPSDALKTSFFTDYGNLDFVYTPWFNADRGITGARVSYYNPMTDSIEGRNAIIDSEVPDDGEYALRLYKTIAGNELALYGYHGYWKSAMGFNPQTGNARHPKMRSLGASARRPVWKGIANIEVGYYDSYEKSAYQDPFTTNSEARFLIGYEQEVMKNFSVGLQYYVEWMQDYKGYVAGQEMIGGRVTRDEVRHLLTNRLTYMSHQQNVTWSLFTFFSPSDLDAYFRPTISYKVTDAWMTEVGGNFFVGKEKYSFFGQFEQNNNVYMSVRYSF